MSNTSIEDRVKVLQERLGVLSNHGGLDAPRTGSVRRPRPVFNKKIPAFPPKSPHAADQDRRFREVYKEASGRLNVGGIVYKSSMEELQHLGELGSGTCGQVVKMLHKPSGAVIAVKQMRRSSDSEEMKRILMDLDVVCSHSCPFIVRCYGWFVTEADVWICMELMATCFDKLLKRLGAPIPEAILGKVVVATVKALSYLKVSHGVIHRDVKPSNILLDERGNIKLCDFGISGRLVDSKAMTRGAGCAAYMAPERIEPPNPSKPVYDIRADVWSLGISLVELATGVLPYKNCLNDFEVLTRVLKEDPPRLPDTSEFSNEFKSFVSKCLTKDVEMRPKYDQLLEHPFVSKSEKSRVNVSDWYASLPPSQTNGTPYKSPTATSEWSTGEAADPAGTYVSRAQHWIDQVTPQPQRAWWAKPTLNTAGSSSQPTSLETDFSSFSPSPRRRTIDAGASPPPPPPVRRVSVDSRWRPSPANPGNTSPVVLQRFYHQNQQRRSRVDQHHTPRHRSLSREHSNGRSPEPPPRTSRHHHMLGHEANGSGEIEPPPFHERLHPPSPLLLNNRLMEGRSQSLSRAMERPAAAPPAPPAPPARRDDPSWLASLAGLLKRRLGGYAKWKQAAAPEHPPLGGRNRYRWGPAESWSMPASPLPPRAPPPRPD